MRDVTFGEDASQIRTGAASQVRGACCNLIMALLRRHGHRNITAALRTDGGRAVGEVQLVETAGVMKFLEPRASPAPDHRAWDRVPLAAHLISAYRRPV